jgi:protein O-mannosyl-transferase
MVLIVATLLTIVVYWRFLSFGHISWDDPEMVFKNRAVRDFDLISLFTGSFVGNYIPFTMLVHAIAWWLFENYNGGHHAVSIVLHVVNGVLVYAISQRLFSDRRFSGITALVFLLHPLQLESVGWISELKNTLSGAFYFASVLFYLRFAESRRRHHYLLCFVLFVAGCLSKSSVVILPLTLLGIDVFLQGRFRMSFLVNKLPFLIVSLTFGIVNLKTQAAGMFINYSHAFPYHERIGYAGYALVRYSGMFLVPYDPSVLYPYPADKTIALTIGFVFLLILGWSVFRLVKAGNLKPVALIFLCVTGLILVLQLIPFGEVLYADRYMYIPLVFFTMLLLYVLRQLKVSLNYPLCAAVIALPVITFLRTDVWRSSVSLYTDILEKFPTSFVALNSLGAEYMLQNDDANAIQYLNRAIGVSPQNYKGYYNRGLLKLKTNSPQNAIADFDRAIELHDYHKAYVGRASAYYMLHDLSNAMKDARYVLQRDPQHGKALFVLANCHNSLNQLDSAILLYNRSISIIDDDAEFYFRRGIAHGKKQDFRSCLTDLNACIRLNPLYFEAYYWRGVAKVNLRLRPCDDLRIAARNRIGAAETAFDRYCR